MERLSPYLSEFLFAPERLTTVLAALAVVSIVGMVTGPSHGNANPWLWLFVGKTFGGIGDRLDRKQRREADLVFRGFFITVAAMVLSFALGQAAQTLSFRYPLHGVTEIMMLSFVITSGSTWFALLRLYFAMRDKKVSQGAYYAVVRTTRTDLSASDDYGITRTGMAMAARGFDKGLVAPVLWYLIAGLPGAFVYAGLAACAWRFGKDGFTKGFGRTALVLEKLAGFAPMVFSGMLMALAGLFTPTGGMTRAFIGQLFGYGRAKYEEGGLPVTAMAYALKVTLGGPVTDLEGSVLKRAWTGPQDATARL